MTPSAKGVKLYWNGKKFIDPNRRYAGRFVNNGGYRRYLTHYVAEREAVNIVMLNPHLVGNVFVLEEPCRR